MKNSYAGISLATISLILAANGFSQGPKPQPLKQVRFASAQPMVPTSSEELSSARGTVPDECATAQLLSLTGTCVPVVVSTFGATESLPPILCNGFTSPDADDVWFEVTSTSESTIVEVLGTDDYDAVLEVFTGTCGSLTSIGCIDDTFPPNSTLEAVNITGPSGTTFYIRVYTYSSPVPSSSEFTICAYNGADPPPNDDCDGAIVQPLAAGGSIIYSGDNTGATEDLDGFTMVWEAFTTTVCTDVVIDYCVPGSVFENFFVNLAPNCPDILDGLLEGEFDDCTVTFVALPAGTYYIPVMVMNDGSTPQGAYQISVSATACGPGYCGASAALCDEYIAQVQIGTINNASGCSDGPVVDYTAISTSIAAGASLPITVTNGPDVYDEDQVVVWVDWNQNQSFLDAGEAFPLSSANGAISFTGTITAPPGAMLGSTRMRIRMMWTGTPSPCGSSAYGEVEDYTLIVTTGGGGGGYCSAGADGTGLGLDERIINVTVAGINNNSANVAPVAPAYTDYTAISGTMQAGSTYPISIGVSSSIGTTYDSNQALVWIDLNQDEDFDDAGEQVFVSAIDAVNAYTGDITIPGGTMIGATRMRVRLHDTHDGSLYINNFNDTPCGIASYGEVEDYTIMITSGGGGGYCSAGADGTGLGLDERIINVTVAGINNNSANVAPVAPAYTDYTAISGTMQAGSTYPISIGVSSSIGTTYDSNQVLVWIDLNQDEDFDDAGEQVFVSAIDAVNAYTGDITIPGGTMIGATRMRVRLHDTHDGSLYINNFNDTPCGIASYGEVEDYTIMIDASTSIDDIPASVWNVFPNPTNGDVSILYGGSEEQVRISLMDMAGRLVHEEQVRSVRGQIHQVNMAGKLAPGTYVIRFNTEHAHHEQRLVVR